MSRLQAVIGANYGDEGKGRCVDWLASRAESPGVVVRHNSGSQAGHTVVVGENAHVFSHFGSGTLRGWDTVLTHKFVCNPVLFNQEHARLVEAGFNPTVYVEDQCIVSTPLDALLNQLMEAARDDSRHGSCGIGFGETIARYETDPDCTIRAGDALVNTKKVTDYFLRAVEERRVPVDRDANLHRVYQAVKAGQFNWSVFVQNWLVFKKRVKIVPVDRINEIIREKPVIFEGAQGLLLHQDHPNFPHVTRSRTGLEDVVEVLVRADVPTNEYLLPWYCTRAYATRHGAGPFEGEEPSLLVEAGWDIYDPTNAPNKFQGELRVGRLDPLLSFQHVRDDVERGLKLSNYQYVGFANMMISCCDQVPPSEIEAAARHAQTVARQVWLGFGPDSADTEVYRPERRATMGSTSDNTVIEPTAAEATELEKKTEAEQEFGGAQPAEEEAEA